MPFNQVWPGYQRPLEQTELASFIYFTMDSDVKVEIIANKEFEEVTVRPLSKNIKAASEGRKIAFTIDKPGQYTVELDGFHNALHIFANPEADFGVDKSDDNLLYFGPGIHHPGLIEMKSGQTIFIDEGAIVYASILGKNVTNVRVVGYGILDNSYESRDDNCLDPIGCMKFYDSQNIDIKGIICRDSSVWTATLFNCDNISFDNIKTIGMWRYNSDGIDFANCANGIVKNCFLRNFDDCVVLKGLKGFDTRNVENILVKNCVIWCDWGRGLEIGAETCAEEYKNIIFEDCDIIHSAQICMDLQNGDRAKIHGLRFQNIRVEYSKYALPPVLQESDEMVYAPNMSQRYLVEQPWLTPDEMVYAPNISKYYMPKLFFAHLYYGVWSKDYIYGENYDVVFKDIFVYLDEELTMPQSAFLGVNKEHKTRDITIDGLYVNGKKITSLDDANVILNEFTENIVIR
jgi:hypothetical protein